MLSKVRIKCLPFVSPFTCDLIHSATWLRRKWEYSSQHGLEKWKIARHSGTTGCSTLFDYSNQSTEIDRERETEERDCVCPRVLTGDCGSDKAEQTITESSRTHSTPLLCSSEEHVGRISKRTADRSEGEIKKNNKNIPAGPPFVCPTFCSALPRVGQRGWFRFDVSTLQCSLSTYHWFPVMHCCPTPIRLGCGTRVG